LLEGYTPTITASPVAPTTGGSPAVEPETNEEEPKTGETPSLETGGGSINPDDEGFSAPTPGEDDLGPLPEPDSGPETNPEIPESSPTISKEV